MVLLTFSHDDFLTLGLKMLGFSEKTIEKTCNATNVERFRDSYYTYPKIASILFDDLQKVDWATNVKPRHLLLALYYLKKYPTKHAMAAFLHETEKTALKWAHRYIKMIQDLKTRTIQWLFDDININEHPESFIISVDGIHCRIWEPRTNPSSGWLRF